MPNFIRNNRDQGLFVSLDLNNQLIKGSLEYTIDDLVEKHLDLSGLNHEFNNDLNGAPAYHPKDLLKVLFFAFLRGIYSSRNIERLCKENIVFMALSGDQRPDHATIARFINKLEKHIVRLFRQVLLYCDSLDLLSGTAIAFDGCKITSNAAKESSGTFSELEKKADRYQVIAEDLVRRAERENRNPDDDKSVQKYQNKINRIKNFLETHDKRMGSKGKEVKSNITDNQSAKLKSSHGVIQGYNALAAVDEKHQIITAAKAVGTQNEGRYLKDLLESSRKILPKKITKKTTLLADTGYFSEENCRLLFTSEQKAVIPDNHFRQRDPRFHRPPGEKNINPRNKGRRLFDHEKFRYDEKRNLYICPAGKLLRSEGKRNMHGHLGRRYMQKDGACSVCHLKARCLRKGAEKRSLFIVDIPKPMTFSDKMKKIIDSPEGKDLYSRRMGIVEPVFGNITSNKRLNRFHYRGEGKVNTLWMLYCMVHNIEKIHRYGKKE